MRADRVRALVLEAYAAVRSGRLADRALERGLRGDRSLSSHERRAVAEGVYATLRLQARIDWLLARAVPRLDALPTPAQNALRWACALVLGGEEPVSGALALAGPEAQPHAEALARIARGEIAPPAEPLARLAYDMSMPEWLARLWRDELGDVEAGALGEAMNQRAPLMVRANVLRTDREKLVAALAAEGVEARATRYAPHGVELVTRVNAFGLRAFKEGLFEVQDEGSQLVSLMAGARPGKTAVDACAGAGGKTLALAAEMRNRGHIVAFDVDERRLHELKRRARRAGVHNARTLVAPEGPDGERAVSPWYGKCDAVLVDAPCSGLGTLRRNPDARWRLTPETLSRFPPLQRAILERYLKLVVPGGRLTYVTCAIHRAENDEVVEAFLGAHAELRALDAAEALGAEVSARLEVPAGEKTLRLFPHRHGTDGFYAVSMLKRR